MKTDLATTILTAAAGLIIAYLICGLFLPEIEAVSIKELEGEITYELAEPDINIFNFRALNPTVEVYVGNQSNTSDDTTNATDTTTPENSPDNGEQNGSSD